jgi:hypothetical protein
MQLIRTLEVQFRRDCSERKEQQVKNGTEIFGSDAGERERERERQRQNPRETDRNRIKGDATRRTGHFGRHLS